MRQRVFAALAAFQLGTVLVVWDSDGGVISCTYFFSSKSQASVPFLALFSGLIMYGGGRATDPPRLWRAFRSATRWPGGRTLPWTPLPTFRPHGRTRRTDAEMILWWLAACVELDCWWFCTHGARETTPTGRRYLDSGLVRQKQLVCKLSYFVGAALGNAVFCCGFHG